MTPQELEDIVAGVMRRMRDETRTELRGELAELVKAIPEGKQGPSGRDGKDGKDGMDGQDGKDGQPGPAGEPGPSGDAGRDGQNGKDGRDGLPGTPGERGPIGEKGLDGKDGRDGRDGKDGITEKELTAAVEAAVSARLGLLLKSAIDEAFAALPIPVYKGVWREDAASTYTAGNMLTHGGSLWHCNYTSLDKPGVSEAWKLVAKKGRDGRDAERAR